MSCDGMATGIPARMRAAYITDYGPASAIRYGELPMPAIGPTDVLVKVEAVVVNPVDTFIRSGAAPTPTPFPFIVGRDLAGTVAVAGRGAVGFAAGDRVWYNSLGHGGRQGSFAEYACAPAERLYHLPAGADPVDAVGVFHPAATAFLGLFCRAGLRTGETVFVGGGAGNVGEAVIRLASAAGARVVASARPADFGRCRAAGAAAVIDYRAPGLASRVRESAPEGVGVYWDTSGNHDLDSAVGLLARGGRVVLAAGLQARPDLPVGPLYTRDGSLVGFTITGAWVGELAQAAAAINRLLARKALPARVAEVLPLAETAKAHAMVEQGRAHGRRVVLRP
jgi:NADPH:quinone reductase-like Zn-dependent oxidoreductase